ncbi:hypothetical protein NEMBOFW57_009537 [Staphylotrichum longicolle]|uniref:Uncharacterized protein n=1 Tax=Staphylotrichum longicolle TaxID=669026 RepID=A0AAD4EP78_9PEZI|nr:hypothetical protein NEMBOFW57_009537 [Staphylotrichum longicolle]
MGRVPNDNLPRMEAGETYTALVALTVLTVQSRRCGGWRVAMAMTVGAAGGGETPGGSMTS